MKMHLIRRENALFRHRKQRKSDNVYHIPSALYFQPVFCQPVRASARSTSARDDAVKMYVRTPSSSSLALTSFVRPKFALSNSGWDSSSAFRLLLSVTPSKVILKKKITRRQPETRHPTTLISCN